MTSQINLTICPFDAYEPAMKRVDHPTTRRLSVSVNNLDIHTTVKRENSSRKRGLKSLGRFLSKKLLRRSMTSKKHAEIPIRSKNFNRQNSIRSVEFWEEDFVKVAKRRSNQTSTPIKLSA